MRTAVCGRNCRARWHAAGNTHVYHCAPGASLMVSTRFTRAPAPPALLRSLVISPFSLGCRGRRGRRNALEGMAPPLSHHQLCRHMPTPSPACARRRHAPEVQVLHESRPGAPKGSLAIEKARPGAKFFAKVQLDGVSRFAGRRKFRIWSQRRAHRAGAHAHAALGPTAFLRDWLALVTS